MNLLNFLLFGLALILVPQKGNAFTELTWHGYRTCTACHLSMVGGDGLTEYGQGIATELLSQNKTKYQSLNTGSWLQLNASMKWLQTHTENSQVSKGRFFLMQLESGANFQIQDQTSIYVSVGRFEPSDSNADWRKFFYLPQYWVKQKLNWDSETKFLELKVGRFLPSYGLNLAEHIYLPRQWTGLVQGYERQAAELSFENENLNTSVSILNSKAKFDQFSKESGAVASVNYWLNDKVRIGGSIYRSELETSATQTEKKQFEGLNALVHFPEKISWLNQFDHYYFAAGTSGVSFFSKLTKNISDGFYPFATYEYGNTDTRKTEPHIENYGVGLEYFPWTHIHLTGVFRLEKNSAVLDEQQQTLWFLAHLYW